jgi:hypothetical protein
MHTRQMGEGLDKKNYQRVASLHSRLLIVLHSGTSLMHSRCKQQKVMLYLRIHSTSPMQQAYAYTNVRMLTMLIHSH